MELQTLPRIYGTTIPDQVRNAIQQNTPLIVVTAPTGFGKTFFLTRLLAEIPQTSHILMPYRISVKEMYSYVSSFNTDNSHSYQYGYRMRGETQGDNNDDCTMFTVGFWLEYFINKFKKGLIRKKHVIVVDEAHDTSWQTDLSLKFLLWLQQQNFPIQIIISSATLDVTENIKSYNPKIFTIEDKANVEMKFLRDPMFPIEKGRMSDYLKEAIIRKLIKIATETGKHGKPGEPGDIFVLLPGEQEIYEIRTTIEANPLFSDYALHDLYGDLPKEEQEEAIKPNPSKRKIVFTTNIAECAITIKGGLYVIDSCLRKEVHIDRSGISQLVLTKASQANIKQFSGRVGREGKRGTSFIMLSASQFENLDKFPSNEIERNPLYHQIMKIMSNDLPVFDILKDIPTERIHDDIQELVKVGAIQKSDMKVTEIGKIISVLPLSLQASSFLSKILMSSLDKTYFHISCVIASWIDLKTSLFVIPKRKPNESEAAFLSRKELIEEKQEHFHGSDCLNTFLKVWLTYEMNSKNGIYERSIKEVFNNTKHCIESLKKIGIEITEYKLREAHIPMISKAMLYYLLKSFPDRIFDRLYDPRSKGYCYVPRENIGITYVKDNSTDYYSAPSTVLALNLRKSPSGKVIFISKLLEIEDDDSISE